VWLHVLLRIMQCSVQALLHKLNNKRIIPCSVKATAATILCTLIHDKRGCIDDNWQHAANDNTAHLGKRFAAKQLKLDPAHRCWSWQP